MVIDSSAILSIFFNEPERRHFNELIASAPIRLMSTGSYLETSIVLIARYGLQGLSNLKLYCSTASIELVDFDNEQVNIAVNAYAKFGKGKHPAALNFGDCMSYALSKVRVEPLLFKGDDFTQTDIESVTHG